MPRKSKTGEVEQPVERRSSSRLAAIPKPEPVAKSPPTDKPAAKKRKSSLEEVADPVDTDKEVSTTPKKRGRPSKKSVASPESKSAEPEPVVEETAKVTENADFEVVQKESLPSPTSEEVKKAVDAQGTDGQLLVNFVQVSKDEIPSPTSDAIKEIAKQHEDTTSPPKKIVVEEKNEELLKEVHVAAGCNGNCGVETVGDNNGTVPTNGMDLTGQNKNGNGHESTTTTPVA